jgi:hypothetical protein
VVPATTATTTTASPAPRTGYYNCSMSSLERQAGFVSCLAAADPDKWTHAQLDEVLRSLRAPFDQELFAQSRLDGWAFSQCTQEMAAKVGIPPATYPRLVAECERLRTIHMTLSMCLFVCLIFLHLDVQLLCGICRCAS